MEQLYVLIHRFCIFLFDKTLLVVSCGASFAIEIVSEQFEGKRLLERHRLVNAALVEEMKEIHALSIKKAVTPAQWKQQQETQQSTSAA
jgi:stress-induced morphogen